MAKESKSLDLAVGLNRPDPGCSLHDLNMNTGTVNSLGSRFIRFSYFCSVRYSNSVLQRYVWLLGE